MCCRKPSKYDLAMLTVTCAAMMPVSAVFDHVLLAAVALKRGGYDWGSLAFGVGFGGSMICRPLRRHGACLMFPETKSAERWLRRRWHDAVAYLIGFFIVLLELGWHPDPPHRKSVVPGAATAAISCVRY
jgi:hypothetical protein